LFWENDAARKGEHLEMADRFRITKGWAQRFAAEKINVPVLLRRAGLPAGLFEQEKIYITTAELFALWRGVAEMCADPVFGLKLGIELRFERSHPVAIAGVCSRSFGDALQRLARYKQLTCPEEIRVQRKGPEASVEICFIEAKETQPDIMVDLGLSWILNVGQQGSDGAIVPLRLELTRPVKDRDLLERHFGCRVRFKADRDALVFRSSDLDRPFVTHNEELVTMLGTQLETELRERNTGANVGEQVKEMLLRSLAGKRPTLQDVARELGLSARSLQRRLTGAGKSYQQIVEETRRELAHHYLKQRAVELNEAAFLLGFEDANSFFRAFQTWEGTSPGEWRTRVLKD
jgi:AraC-like DNA-binding protein